MGTRTDKLLRQCEHLETQAASLFDCETADRLARAQTDPVGAGKRIAKPTRPAKPRPKAKGKRRPSPTDKPVPLTPKQVEAVQVVGECKGCIAEAARRLGKNHKTIEQHYKAGLEKLGKSAIKTATRQLPADRRGGVNLSEGDDRRLL